MAEDYTKLYNSSRGSVFLVLFFVFLGLIWALLKLVKGRFALYAERYVPPPGAPAPPVPAASAENLNTVSAVRPVATTQQVPEDFSNKVVTVYEEFLTKGLPFLAIAVLNVVMFRCWVYCLVNWFIVFIPMLIFGAAKVNVGAGSLIVATLCRYWAMFWIIGFFINVWTIKSYA